MNCVSLVACSLVGSLEQSLHCLALFISSSPPLVFWLSTLLFCYPLKPLRRPVLSVRLLAMPPSTLLPLLLVQIFWFLVNAQGSAQTFFPAAIPLAVKTPYLNTWYDSFTGSNASSNAWPQFWTLAVSVLLNSKSGLF